MQKLTLQNEMWDLKYFIQQRANLNLTFSSCTSAPCNILLKLHLVQIHCIGWTFMAIKVLKVAIETGSDRMRHFGCCKFRLV